MPQIAPLKPVALAASLALLCAACSKTEPPAPVSAAAPPATATAPAPLPAATPAPAAAPAARTVPTNVQGVASAGVTVRVKSVEIGADATVLDVSISFASRIASSTMLAMLDTYIADESNNRLMLKRPDDNRELTIRDGETLNGKLVFLGAVPPTTRMLRLVFNDSNGQDNIAGPGLLINVPLAAP